MTLSEAQKNMRTSYFSGALGAFVSGIIWLIASMTSLISTKEISVAVFFFGGMIIHPLSIILCKFFKRTGRHKKENPLSHLALESTFLLFIGLFIAFTIFKINPNYFFSIMILIIGTRYLIFNSIYGMKIYWVLGGILIVTGILGVLYNKSFHIIGILGGIIEIIFCFIIIYLEKNKNNNSLT